MSDYSKSVIYKIYKEDITEFYIGSTHDKTQREQQHKSNCNNENCKEYNFKVYEFIRENGGYDKWKYEILEYYPCDNDIQLRIRERYYYDLLKPELNMIRPYVSEEEIKVYQAKYYEEHKEERKEENAKYYEEHKEERKEENAKYRDEKKDYDAKYYQEHIEEKTKYREENKAKNNQKHICECGGKYTSAGKSTHCKTNKHKNYIEKNK